MSNQKSPISPEMKQFLGTLMKKLEKNIKQQYEDELSNVKQQVTVLKQRVKELERELKKQTPLTTATPIKNMNLKKMNTTSGTSYTPQPTKNGLQLDMKSKSDHENKQKFINKRYNKPRTKTYERPPELQRVLTEVDQVTDGVTDYFGNEELLSRKPKNPNKTLDENILKPSPTTPTTTSSKKPSLNKSKSTSNTKNSKPKTPKSPRRSKSPRNIKSPRVKNVRKKSTGTLQTTPSFRHQTKAIVGHRYLLLDDRYGICKWVKGNKMGLELEVGQGDCDGELNGVKKFDCKPGMGLFTSTKNIQMDCGIV